MCFVQVENMSASSASQKNPQFYVDNSNKTRKSTNNQLSNFGLIEETMSLSHILKS